MFRLMGVAFLLATTPVVAQTTPAEEPAPVEKLFIPQGFDDNDNAEIVIHGEFPNTCWRMGQSGATVDQENFEIEVWATAYKHTPTNSATMCAQVLMPFLAPVKTGVLKAGTYSVKVRGQDVSSTLIVAEALTDNPDDYLYALVNFAGVDSDPISGDQSLWVKGTHPRFLDGCMVIDEVRAYKNPENVLIVLPIGRMEDGDVCGQTYHHDFFVRVPLADPVTEESLLHVRVLNGQSHNQLIQIQ